MAASPTIDFAPGNYRYVPSVFQYSSGAAAMPGYHIERVMFRKPVPLKQGFERIAALIQGQGRPLTAFCACELRSPAPFDDAGFKAFNEVYVGTLAAWGIYNAETKANPVARSNVCPEIGGPPEPSFHAFSYVAEGDAGGAPQFVIAGSGEAREGAGAYAERIVRLNDTSPAACARRASSSSSRWRSAWRPSAMAGRTRRRRRSIACTTSTLPRRRDRPARRSAGRHHLALQPPAGDRPRLRDGLP